jgi:hypothetical protein
MGDYQSYSTYVAPEEAQETPYRAPVIRDTGETTSVTVRDGVMVSETSHNNSFIKASELTPYEADDWRSTALKPSGFPAHEILPETIVSLGGTQGRVQDFVAAGILQQGPNGYELAPAIAETQGSNETSSDAAEMPQALAAAVDEVLAPFDQNTLDSGLGLAISSVTGEVDLAAVVRSVAMKSGMEPKDAQARIQFTMDAYQSEADHYLAKQGISKDDLPAFYEYAKSQRAALRELIQAQMYHRDLSGWKGMVSKFMTSNAPSTEALQANGFAVRTVDKQNQVRINGTWLSVQAAARANLI